MLGIFEAKSISYLADGNLRFMDFFFGELTFKDGVPEKTNFDKYRMIRQAEAPKSIEVHFVKNDVDPTGLGEPLFPPVFAALANSLYKATGKRLYDQPFQPQLMEMKELKM